MNKSGVVEVVNKNKAGYYAFKVEGENTWYNTGKVSGGIEKGDNIEFEFNKNNRGYFDVDIDSIKRAVASKGVEGGVQGRESYWQEKAVADVANHREIRWRSAVHTAISIIEVANSLDCSPIPKSGTRGAKFDAVVAVVNELALGVYNSFESSHEVEDPMQFQTIHRLNPDEFDDAAQDESDTPF